MFSWFTDHIFFLQWLSVIVLWRCVYVSFSPSLNTCRRPVWSWLSCAMWRLITGKRWISTAVWIWMRCSWWELQCTDSPWSQKPMPPKVNNQCSNSEITVFFCLELRVFYIAEILSVWKHHTLLMYALWNRLVTCFGKDVSSYHNRNFLQPSTYSCLH